MWLSWVRTGYLCEGMQRGLVLMCCVSGERERNGGTWAEIQQMGLPVLLIHGESCLQLLGKGVSISTLESRVLMAKSG